MGDETEDWVAGSNRAMDEHDPAREPYASMSREELAALMQQDGLSGYEFERLNQHFLDKCSGAELERINFATELGTWLMDRREVFGPGQMKLCVEVANEATARLFGEMPPPGPLHEIN